MNDHLRRKYDRLDHLDQIREEHNNYLENRRQQKDMSFNNKMAKVQSMKDADKLAMREV